MKKQKRYNDENIPSIWQVTVEAVGTPIQRERALKQATRYVLSRLASRKNLPSSGKLHY